VVHEVLSREPGEEVVFDEIVRSLVLLVEDTVLALHPVEIVVNGTSGCCRPTSRRRSRWPSRSC